MPEDAIDQVEAGVRRADLALATLRSHSDQWDWIGVLRGVNATITQLQEVAIAAVELGIREGKTQKALADALGVPASTLRGAKKEFA